MDGRTARGRTAFHAGVAAEDSVACHYEGQGMRIAAKRWRGKAGEIDLILEDGDEVVFVEVKKSKSSEAAAQMLSNRQIARLLRAAEEFLGKSSRGALTPCRFDVGLVDGQGAVSILPNAIMA